jgi:hypothetical protein
VTQLFDVSRLWRVVSPRHRKVHLRSDWVEILALVLRLVGVGLLSAVGWIHLHLWQAGYRHIPTIGPLFLAAGVSAFVVGAGEVRTYAAVKGGGEDLADRARTDRPLAGIDASGADRHEHLVGPRLRTPDVAYLEDRNTTVILEFGRLLSTTSA